MLKSKGFVQIPILILAVIIVSVVVAGIFLYSKEKLSLPVNISEVSQMTGDTTTNIKEEKPEEIEQKPESQKEIKEPVKDYDELSWQWVSNQKKLFELTSTEIDLILKEIKKRFSDKNERLKALSILRLGTLYQFGCLGEESGIDKDPIFRLDVTDCTVFLLTNVALLHSQNFREAREMMKFLNYRQENEITFENRLHFTTDRNMISPYFQDITEQIAGPGKIKEKIVILNKIKSDGKRLIDIDWEKEMVMRYIPNKYITQELLSKLPKALGIAFFREEDANIGLDVVHEGFLFEGKDFIHASSAQREVVRVNFLDYYFDDLGNSRFDGIILFEVK